MKKNGLLVGIKDIGGLLRREEKLGKISRWKRYFFHFGRECSILCPMFPDGIIWKTLTDREVPVLDFSRVKYPHSGNLHILSMSLSWIWLQSSHFLHLRRFQITSED